MRNEVNDIHPMLEELFNKMDSIKKVEYKQGALENGADFVLIKNDPAWDIEEYVGIIVKRDSINKSSNDVIRQIDECVNTPRTVNGKKSINLDEVWVITISNISISAQQFFQNKFKSTKIKFIDGNQLAKFVDKLLPDYFLGIPHKINNYLTRAKDKISTLEMNAQLSFHTMTGIRLEQDLIPIEKKKYKQNNGRSTVARKTTIARIIEKKSASIIEGGMGSGKSSLLRKTAVELLDIDNYIKTKKLPIYITFKELQDSHSFDLARLIDKEIGNELEEGTEIIILLDGVDESPHGPDERLDIIDSIIKQADYSENIRLIMTARDFDSEEFSTKITRTFRTYRISPISFKQIIRVLEDCCKTINIKTRIIEDLKKSSLYKALPRTPIAAILLARLLNENQNDIPSNLTELYSKFTELALGRWDISKGIIHEKEYSALDNITKKIAVYFIENGLSQISIEEAKGFFVEHLNARNLGIKPEDLFKVTEERGEIFYIDRKNGIFGFKHRTFVEFFYAKHLQSLNDKSILESDLDLYWATIHFFWVGLKKDCPEILKAFSDIQPSSDKYSLLKIMNLSNMLLAGYQSPYEVIRASIETVFLEAAKYYIGICKGQIESKLTGLSEMHLLGLFRYLMAESYGYEFFSEAIDDAILKISENRSVDADVTATALFLLDTAQVKPVIENLFSIIASKGMIEKSPMAVQLAIRHEAKDKNISNPHTKKIDRNIKRIVTHHSVQERIRSMYDLPVENLFKGKKLAADRSGSRR